jgi:hypothetical protein
MAHVGITWPVVTRRDFNLNVNSNNVGWANRYKVTLNILPPVIGNGLQGTEWECGPSGVSPIDRMFWASDPDLFGGFVFDVIITASIVDGQRYIKRCQIREAVNGVILNLELANDPSPFFPVWPVFHTWKTIFRDPFFFTGDGFANQVNCLPKEWADGPPH